MAKILITSLGVGDKSKGYKIASYKIDNKIYENITFIAKALIEHYAIDKVFFFGTSASIWDSVYSSYMHGTDENYELELMEKQANNSVSEDDLNMLNETIDKYCGFQGSKCFIVSYGINDEELWQNYEKYLSISDMINDKDEIYLDITHSFRSLAFMSFLMMQFLQQIREKDISITKILYGMYEATQNGVAPVVDLTIFSELQEWTRAIGILKYTGNAYALSTLINRDHLEYKKEERLAFEHLANAFSLGNMITIKNCINM